MFNTHRLLVPTVILLGFLLTACGGGGKGAAPAPEAPTTISITPANLTLRSGATQQLIAMGSFSGGSTQDITASVTWTSSADASATVSNAGGSSGLVTAAAIGSATITAAFGPTTGTTTLTIIKTVSLPKTGQTTCADVSGTVINCAGTGQDGDLQTGVAAPNPRFVLDGTGNCVTDQLTGLMWTKNANLPAGAGAASTGTRTWQQALAFANDLQLCGFTDWRLPNRNELRSLVNNYSQSGNANLQNFSNIQGDYWTSTSFAGGASQAWFYGMGDGVVRPQFKSSLKNVWPVRGGL
jgi:hypothetical protein